MSIIGSAKAGNAAGALFLAVLSVLPYAMVYGIDRVLGAPNAARAALWPTAIVPVLVVALLTVPVLRRRIFQPATAS